MRLLVAAQGNQPPLALGRRIPTLVGRADAAFLGHVRVLTQVQRPFEGEDETEDGGVHDQLGAFRLFMAAVISRVIGTTPPSTNDVADVHGRLRPIGVGPPFPTRLPDVDARVGPGDAIAPCHVAPVHAARADLSSALRKGGDVALVSRVIGTDAPRHGQPTLGS